MMACATAYRLVGVTQFVDEEPEKVLLLFGLVFKESGEETQGLRADVGEWVQGKCFQGLENREEVFLEPVFIVPYDEMGICYFGMQ